MTEQEARKAINLKGGIEITGIGNRVAEFLEGLSVAQKALEKIQQYRALGTVEELKEAREKQASKKVIETDDKPYGGKCPCCGEVLYTSFMDTNYCHWCGNKLTALESE